MAIKLLLHKSIYERIAFASLFKGAVHFAVDHFDLADVDWRVEIYLQETVQSDNFKDEILGQCVNNHTHRISKVYVSYKNRSVYSVIGTLFHEMAHVKQAAKDEVIAVNSYTFLWAKTGKPLGSDNILEYWFSPDEVDARHWQRVLTRKYAMKRLKQMLANWFKRKPLTEEQLDWNYNDRKPSYAEMQARRDNMSNPGDKDYDL